MVSSLAFSTFKAGLPSVISMVHSELIFKKCTLQSFLTQVDLMDPDISFFQGQSWGLIVTCIGDWGFLIWIGVLYSCWEKNIGKISQYHNICDEQLQIWAKVYLTKFILWLRTVWKCLSQKHWDLIRSWGDHSVQWCSHSVFPIPLIEIKREWYIWALQSSKIVLNSVWVFLLEFE